MICQSAMVKAPPGLRPTHWKNQKVALVKSYLVSVEVLIAVSLPCNNMGRRYHGAVNAARPQPGFTPFVT